MSAKQTARFSPKLESLEDRFCLSTTQMMVTEMPVGAHHNRLEEANENGSHGLGAFPLVDPHLIIDITGNGPISGLDASLIKCADGKHIDEAVLTC